jgi:hypothetical protein
MAFTTKQIRRLWWLAGTVALLVMLAPFIVVGAFMAVRYNDAVTRARGCGPWTQAEVETIVTENLMRKSPHRPSAWAGYTEPVFTRIDAEWWPKVPAMFWYREMVVQRPNHPDEVWRAMVDCTHDVTYSFVRSGTVPLLRVPASASEAR